MFQRLKIVTLSGFDLSGGTRYFEQVCEATISATSQAADGFQPGQVNFISTNQYLIVDMYMDHSPDHHAGRTRFVPQIEDLRHVTLVVDRAFSDAWGANNFRWHYRQVGEDEFIDVAGKFRRGQNHRLGQLCCYDIDYKFAV